MVEMAFFGDSYEMAYVRTLVANYFMKWPEAERPEPGIFSILEYF